MLFMFTRYIVAKRISPDKSEVFRICLLLVSNSIRENLPKIDMQGNISMTVLIVLERWGFEHAI